MPDKKDLITAVAYCANRENRFPGFGEGCRSGSCPLYPFCADARESCIRCIECVLKATLDYLKAECNEEVRK